MEVSVLSVDSLYAWRYQCYQKAVYTDGGISVISRQSMHKEVSVLSVDSLYSSRYQCD